MLLPSLLIFLGEGNFFESILSVAMTYLFLAVTIHFSLGRATEANRCCGMKRIDELHQ